MEDMWLDGDFNSQPHDYKFSAMPGDLSQPEKS